MIRRFLLVAVVALAAAACSPGSTATPAGPSFEPVATPTAPTESMMPTESPMTSMSPSEVPSGSPAS